MSEDMERVLRMALKAMLVAAQECCVDKAELCRSRPRFSSDLIADGEKLCASVQDCA